MSAASIFIIVFLVGILAADWVFLPRQARRALWVMSLVFLVIAGAALFPGVLSSLAELVGIGRGADLVIYVALIILIREYFLARARQSSLDSRVTQLVRQIALSEGQRKPSPRT